MTSIIVGNGLGLQGGSLTQANGLGPDGNPAVGAQGPAQAYVNAATGNLVVQTQDEFISSLGLADESLLDTYNSLGSSAGFASDGWLLNLAARLVSPNSAAGSTLTRVDPDGHVSTYTYNASFTYTNSSGLTVTGPAWTNGSDGGINEYITYSGGVYTLHEGATGLIQTYNSVGQLSTTSDLNNNTISYNYLYSNNVLSTITISGANGQSAVLQFDATGQMLQYLKTTTIPPGGTSATQIITNVQYKYDSQKRLIAVQTELTHGATGFGDGNVFSVQYSYQGTTNLISQIAQSDGSVLNIAYYSSGANAGRVQTLTDGLGRTTTFSYTAANGSVQAYTTVTDSLNNNTVYTYNSNGQLTSLKDPAGTTYYAYDSTSANSNVQQVTDPRGNATYYTYNSHHDLTQVQDSLGNTTQRTYDNADHLLTETTFLAPQAVKTTPTASAGNSVTTYYVYSTEGKENLLFSVSGQGRVTQHLYDQYGELTNTIEYTGALYTPPTYGAALSLGALQTWAASQNTAQTQLIQTAWDLTGQIKTVTTYQSYTSLSIGTSAATPVGASIANVLTTIHDAFGRILIVADADATGVTPTQTQATAHVTVYTYDGLNRLLTAQSNNGAVSYNSSEVYGSYSLPAAGTAVTAAGSQLNTTVTTTAADGIVTSSVYDSDGELITSTDSAGGVGLTTNYWYDQDGHLVMVADPMGNRTIYLYDPEGRRVGTITPAMELTENAYNADSQVIQTIQRGTLVSANAVAAYLSASPGSPTVANPLILAQVDPGAGSDIVTSKYYDNAGRLAYEVDSAGTVTGYVYNGESQLVQATVYATPLANPPATGNANSISIGSSPGDQVSHYFYDNDGLKTGTLDPSGTLTQNQFDDAGNLIQQTIYNANLGYTAGQTLQQLLAAVPAGTTAVSQYRFYDNQGREVGAIDGAGTLTQTIYDGAGNKTQQTTYSNSVTYTGQTLATLVSLASVPATDQVQKWQYDGVGRPTQYTDAVGTVTQYTYDADNNILTQTVNPGGLNLVTKNAYDALERLINVTDANNKTSYRFYNADSQVVDSIDAAGNVTGYQYDADGRVIQTVQYAQSAAPAFQSNLSQSLSSQFFVGGTSPTESPAGITFTNAMASGSSVLYQGNYSLSNGPVVFHTEISNFTSGGAIQLGAIGWNASTSVGLTLSVQGTGLATFNNQTLGTLTAGTTYEVDIVMTTGGATCYLYAKGSSRSAAAVASQLTNNLTNCELYAYAPSGGTYGGQTITVTGFSMSTLATDPANETATTLYNGLGQVSCTVDPLGNVTRYQYDADGRVVQTIRYATAMTGLGANPTPGSVQSAWTAQQSGMAANPANEVTTTIYNGLGQVAYTVDAAGNVAGIQYDLDGRAIQATRYATPLALAPNANAGAVLSALNANLSTLTANAANEVTRSIYNNLGEVAFDIDAMGDVTGYQYDGDGRVIQTTRYATAISLASLPATPRVDDVYAALAVTAAPAFQNIFSQTNNTSGLTLTNVSNPVVQNGQLIFTNGTSASSSGSVYQGNYQLSNGPVMFHAEFSLSASTGSFQMGLTGANMAEVYLSGLSAYLSTPSGFLYLGALQTNTTYEVDMVATGTDVTCYLYAQNSSRGSGYIARANMSLSSCQMFAYVGGYSTFANQTMAVNRFSVYQMGPNAANDVSRTIYNGLGQVAYDVDTLGDVTAYQYDLDGRVTQTTKYPTPINLSSLPPVPNVADIQFALALAMPPPYQSNFGSTQFANLNKTDAGGQLSINGSGQLVMNCAYATSYEYGIVSQGNYTTSAGPVVFQTEFVTPSTSGGAWYVGLGGSMYATLYLTGQQASLYTSANGYTTLGTLTSGVTYDLVIVATATDVTCYVYPKGSSRYSSSAFVSHQVQNASWYDLYAQAGGGPSYANQKLLINSFGINQATSGTGQISNSVYDAAGRLTYAVDPQGNITGYKYDADNRVIQTTEYATPLPNTVARNVAAVTSWLNSPGPTNSPASDRITHHYYNAVGQEVYTADAAGYVTARAFDAFGNVLSQTQYWNAATSITTTSVAVIANSNLDRTTHYYYDLDNHLIATLDADGYLTQSFYNAQGQVFQTTAYAVAPGFLGGATAATASFAQLAITPSAGDHTQYAFFDGDGRIIASIDAYGYVTAESYDAFNNLKSRTRYAKPVTYTGVQTLATLETSASNTSLPSASAPTITTDQTESYQYDADNRAVFKQDYQGTGTLETYNALGRLIAESTGANADGTPQFNKQNQNDERTTTYIYNALGQLTNSLTGLGTVAYQSNSSTLTADGTTSVYNGLGQLIESTDADQNHTFYYYNSDNQLQYKAQQAGLASSAQYEVTYNQYDAFGDLISSTQYANRISSSNLVGGSILSDSAFQTAVSTIANATLDRTTKYAFGDNRGLLTLTTDPLKFIKSESYNAFGELKAENIDEGASPGAITRTDQFVYDNRGSLLQEIRDTKAGGLNIATSAKYDAFGRVIQAIDGLGNTTITSYSDQLGHTVKVTDPLNNQVTTTYDAFGRVLARTDALQNKTTYSYFDATQTVVITDPAGNTVTTVSNRHGQTIKVTDGTGATTTYAFDQDGNQLSTTDANGNVTSQTYDKVDLLQKSWSQNSQAVVVGPVTSYTYDAAERIIAQTVDPTTTTPAHTGLNLKTQYIYNAFGQAFQVIDPAGVITETVYDNDGRATAVISDAAVGGLRLATTYALDAQGRALTVQRGMLASGGTGGWTFAPSNGTTTFGTTTTQYVYDDIGRVIYSVDSLGNVTGTTYDAASHAIQVIQYAVPLTSAVARTASGISTYLAATPIPTGQVNLVTASVYDADGRLVYAIDADGNVAGYQYDADSRVIQTIRYAQKASPTFQATIQGASSPSGTGMTPYGTLSATGTALAFNSSAYGEVTKGNYLLGNGPVVFHTEISSFSNTGYFQTGVVGWGPNNQSASLYMTLSGANASFNGQSLGTLSAGVYEVDIVMTPTGATCYLYAKGTPRSQAAVAFQQTATLTSCELVAQTPGGYSGQTLVSAIGISTLATDPSNGVSTTVYNNLGEVAYSIDAVGNVTGYQYDADGRKTQTTRFTTPILLSSLPTTPTQVYAYVQSQLATAQTDAAAGKILNQGQSVTSSNNVYMLVGGAGGSLTLQNRNTGQILWAGNTGNLPQGAFTVQSNGNFFITNSSSQVVWQSGTGTASLSGNLVATTVYDPAGRVAYVVDDSGDVTGYLYDAANRLVQTTKYATPLQLPSSNATPAQIQALLTTAPASSLTDQISSRIYDSAGRLAYAIDPLGNVTGYVCDSDSRVIQVTQYAAQATMALRTSALSVVVSTNLLQIFNAYNVVIWQTGTGPAASPSDRVTRQYYDTLGRDAYTVDAAGYVIGRTFDTVGNVLGVTQYWAPLSPIPGSGKAADVHVTPTPGLDRLTRYFYDSDNQLIGSLDPDGYLTQNVYNSLGERIQTTAYAAAPGFQSGYTAATAGFAQLVITANAAKDQTTYRFYNNDGLAIASAQEDGINTAYVTAENYDTFNNLTSETHFARLVNYNGQAETAAGLVIMEGQASTPGGVNADQTQSYQYDADNRVIGQYDFQGTGTSKTYNALGELVLESVGVNTTTGMAQANLFGQSDERTSLNFYNTLGQLTNSLTGLGAVAYETNSATLGVDGTSNSYNSLGQLIQSTDADGNRSFYYYNADGQLQYTARQTGLQGSNQYSVTYNQFDAFGDITATTEYASVITIGSGSLKGGSVLTDTTFASAIGAVNGVPGGSFASNPSNRTTKYIFGDNRGLLTKTTDAIGFTTAYQYNSFGEVWYETTDRGPSPGMSYRTDKFTYDNRGALTQTWEDQGGFNIYLTTGYDAFGRVILSVDGNQNQTVTTYNDPLGRSVTVTDPLSTASAPDKATTFYDAFNRVLSSIDAFGNSTSYSYNDATQTVVITDPLKQSITTVSNRYGQTIQVTDATKAVTQYQFDQDGNLVKTTDPNLITTSKTYDNADLLLSSQDGVGTITTYSYDAARRVLVQTVDPNSAAASPPYAGLNLATQYNYNAFGEAYQVSDPANMITETVHDKDGRTTAVITDATRMNLATQYVLDAQGHDVLVQEGMTANLNVDAWGNRNWNLVATNGTGSTSIGGRAISTGTTTTKYVFDNLGRRTQQIVDPTGLALTTKYQYDANNNLTSITDPVGNTTYKAYTADNKLAFELDPVLNVGNPAVPQWSITGYSYDFNGRLIQKVGYAAEGPLSLTWCNAAAIATYLSGSGGAIPANQFNEITNYIYDADGRCTFVVDPDGNVTGYQYDADNRLTQTVRYPTQLSSLLNNITSRTPQLTANSTLVGLVIQLSISNASNTNLWTIGLMAGSTNGCEISTSVYDPAGRIAYSVNAAGDVTGYQYDKDGRVTQKTQYYLQVPAYQLWTPGSLQSALSTSTNNEVENSVYDAAGRKAFDIDAVGNVTQYTSDNDNRVTQVTRWAVPLQLSAAVGQTPSGLLALLNAALVGSTVALPPVGQSTYSSNNVFKLSVTAPGLGQTMANLALTNTNTGELLWNVNLATMPAGAASGSVTVQSNGNVVVTAAGGTWTSDPELPGVNANEITQTVYDTAGRHVYTVSGTGDVTRYVLDSVGRTVQTIQYAAQVSPANPWTSDALDNAPSLAPAATPAPGNRTTTTFYDTAGRVAFVIDPMGNVTQTAYQYSGTMGGVTSSNTTIVTTTRYATPLWMAGSVPVSLTLSQVLAQMPAPSSAWWSDTQHNEVDAKTYDGSARLITDANAVYVNGSLSSYTDSYLYDAFDNKIAHFNRIGNDSSYASGGVQGAPILQPGQPVPPWLVSHEWTYRYDADNQMLYAIDPGDSVATSMERGVAKTTFVSKAVQYSYNSFNDVATQVLGYFLDPPNNSQFKGLQTNTYGYDPLNDQVSIDRGMQSVYSSGTHGGITTSQDIQSGIVYDKFHNAVVTTDANGYASYKVFDGDNRLVYSIDALGYVTKNNYDANGNIISVTSYAKALSGLHLIGTAYSMAEVQADLTTSPQDRTTFTAYDADNRKSSVTSPQISYYMPAQWGAGTAATAAAPPADSGTASPVTQFLYDAFGDVIEQSTLMDPNPQTGIQISNSLWANSWAAYNQDGQQIATVDPLGYLTTNTYDAFNNLTGTTQFAAAQSIGNNNLLGLLKGSLLNAPLSLSAALPKASITTSVLNAQNPAPLATGYDRVIVNGYDQLNRKTSIARVGVLVGSHSSSGLAKWDVDTQTNYLVYDDVSDVIETYSRTVDENSTVTTYDLAYNYYDNIGQMVASVSPTQGELVSQTGTTLGIGSAALTIGHQGQSTPIGTGALKSLNQKYSLANCALITKKAVGASNNDPYTLNYTSFGVLELQFSGQTVILWAPPIGMNIGQLAGSYVCMQDNGDLVICAGSGLVIGTVWSSGNSQQQGYLDQVKNVNPLTLYQYDDLGNRVTLTKVANGASGLSQYNYTSNGASALDQRTSTVYNTVGWALEVYNPDNSTVQKSYDVDGNVAEVYQSQTEVLQYNGSVTYAHLANDTTYQYDADNHQSVVTRYIQSPVAGAIPTTTMAASTTQIYNAFGEVGETITSRLDEAVPGQILQSHSATTVFNSYDNDGQLVLTTQANGVKVAYQYDLRGDQTQKQLQGTDYKGNAATITTDMVFDLDGRSTQTLAEEAPYGLTDPAPFNADTWAPSVFNVLDRWGNAVQSVNARYFGPEGLGEEYGADDNRQHWTTTNYYDDKNHLVESIAPPDVAVFANWNSQNNLYQIVTNSSYSATTKDYFDADGRQIATQNTDGFQWLDFFDGGGQLIESMDPNGVATYSFYNGVGQNTVTVQSDGSVVASAYDGMNRLTMQETLGYGTSVASYGDRYNWYWYDEMGNRIASDTGALGNISDTGAWGNLLGGLLTISEFDTQGDLVQQLDPGASSNTAGSAYTVTYYYDSQGNRIGEEDGNGGASGANASKAEAWAYDGFANVQSYSDLDGKVTSYQYDHLDQLIAQTSVPGSQVPETGTPGGGYTEVPPPPPPPPPPVATGGQKYYYTYYDNGLLESHTDQVSGEEEQYYYDAAGELTSTVRTFTQMFYNTEFGPESPPEVEYPEQTWIDRDHENRIITVSDNYSETMVNTSYDENGNTREVKTTSEDSNAGPSSLWGQGTVLADKWYVYDGGNRVSIADAGATKPDASGNRFINPALVASGMSDGIADGDIGEQLQYNAYGQLATVQWFDNSDVSKDTEDNYQYDLGGNIKEIDSASWSPGDPTYYVDPSYTTQQEIKQYDNQGHVVSDVTNDTTGVAPGQPAPQVHDNTFAYNQYGQLQAEVDIENQGASNQYQENIAYTQYDRNGTLLSYYVLNDQNSNKMTYTYSYLRIGGSYDTQTIKATASGGGGTSGTTTEKYDSNGYLYEVDNGSTGYDEVFANTLLGKIIEGGAVGQGPVLGGTTYVYDGNTLLGNGGALEIEQNFMAPPLDPTSQISGPGTYTVQNGDSLGSIAQNVYGDSSLWYLIADANGMGSGAKPDSSLNAGQQLTIPSAAGSAVHDNSKTNEVYDVQSIIGDITPGKLDLQKPPPSQCAQIWATIAEVFIEIASAVASYFTAGAAAGLGAAAVMAIQGAISVGGALIGNATSQLILDASSGQKFSWASFATSGLLAAGSSAVSAVGGSVAGAIAGSVAGQTVSAAEGNGVNGFSLLGAAAGAATGGLFASETTALTPDGLQTQLGYSSAEYSAMSGVASGIVGTIVGGQVSDPVAWAGVIGSGIRGLAPQPKPDAAPAPEPISLDDLRMAGLSGLAAAGSDPNSSEEQRAAARQMFLDATQGDADRRQADHAANVDAARNGQVSAGINSAESSSDWLTQKSVYQQYAAGQVPYPRSMNLTQVLLQQTFTNQVNAEADDIYGPSDYNSRAAMAIQAHVDPTLVPRVASGELYLSQALDYQNTHTDLGLARDSSAAIQAARANGLDPNNLSPTVATSLANGTYQSPAAVEAQRAAEAAAAAAQADNDNEWLDAAAQAGLITEDEAAGLKFSGRYTDASSTRIDEVRALYTSQYGTAEDGGLNFTPAQLPSISDGAYRKDDGHWYVKQNLGTYWGGETEVEVPSPEETAASELEANRGRVLQAIEESRQASFDPSIIDNLPTDMVRNYGNLLRTNDYGSFLQSEAARRAAYANSDADSSAWKQFGLGVGLTAWGLSHFIGVGEAIDVGVLLLGGSAVAGGTVLAGSEAVGLAAYYHHDVSPEGLAQLNQAAGFASSLAFPAALTGAVTGGLVESAGIKTIPGTTIPINPETGAAAGMLAEGLGTAAYGGAKWLGNWAEFQKIQLGIGADESLLAGLARGAGSDAAAADVAAREAANVFFNKPSVPYASDRAPLLTYGDGYNFGEAAAQNGNTLVLGKWPGNVDYVAQTPGTVTVDRPWGWTPNYNAGFVRGYIEAGGADAGGILGTSTTFTGAYGKEIQQLTGEGIIPRFTQGAEGAVAPQVTIASAADQAGISRFSVEARTSSGGRDMVLLSDREAASSHWYYQSSGSNGIGGEWYPADGAEVFENTGKAGHPEMQSRIVKSGGEAQMTPDQQQRYIDSYLAAKKAGWQGPAADAFQQLSQSEEFLAIRRGPAEFTPGREFLNSDQGAQAVSALPYGTNAAEAELEFGGANGPSIASADPIEEAGGLLPESSLSEAQSSIHAQLPEKGSFSLFPTDQVPMEDLVAIGRTTGDEYNLFTKGSQSLVIRGNGNTISVSQDMYRDLINGEYGQWAGHTHPPGYSIEPSVVDRNFLGQMGQEYSTIYGDEGTKIFTSAGPADDARVESEVMRNYWQQLYGEQ